MFWLAAERTQWVRDSCNVPKTVQAHRDTGFETAPHVERPNQYFCPNKRSGPNSISNFYPSRLECQEEGGWNMSRPSHVFSSHQWRSCERTRMFNLHLFLLLYRGNSAISTHTLFTTSWISQVIGWKWNTAFVTWQLAVGHNMFYTHLLYSSVHQW